MKRIIKIFAWSLVVISCNKEQMAVEPVQETQTQPDIIQLLVDNPNRFTEENWTGLESLMDDLQLTEEQRQKCYEEEEIVMQLFPKSNSQVKKRVVLKSVGVKDENDILVEDYFSSLAGLMTEYASCKNVSEQLSQVFIDVTMAVGNLSEKMVEASVVVDLRNLVEEELKKCNSDMNAKYLLTEDETVHLNKLLGDIQRVLIGDVFLADIQRAKIGESNNNALTKGLFSRILCGIGKVVLTIAAVATTAAVGAAIGAVSGFAQTFTVQGATMGAIGGGVVFGSIGLLYSLKHIWDVDIPM